LARSFFNFGFWIADFGFCIFMISNLQKDKSLKKVLTKLFQRFGEIDFDLQDYWEADLCAIGIKNLADKKHLIYISTFKMPKDLYFVQVEKANSETDSTNYDVVGHFNEIGFERLSELVTKYLYLRPIYEQ
jgi:hypothetical protein